MTQQAPPESPQPPDGAPQRSAPLWYEQTQTGSPHSPDSRDAVPEAEHAESAKPRRFSRRGGQVTVHPSSTSRSGQGGWLSRRRIVAITVVGLLVAGAITTWAMRRSSAAVSTVAATRMVTVGSGTVQQAVAATGTVEPTTTSNLSFGAAGQVTAVNVTQGQKVTAGQQLAAISSASLASQVSQAQATIASDEARLSTDQTAA